MTTGLGGRTRRGCPRDVAETCEHRWPFGPAGREFTVDSGPVDRDAAERTLAAAAEGTAPACLGPRWLVPGCYALCGRLVFIERCAQAEWARTVVHATQVGRVATNGQRRRRSHRRPWPRGCGDTRKHRSTTHATTRHMMEEPGGHLPQGPEDQGRGHDHPAQQRRGVARRRGGGRFCQPRWDGVPA